MSNTEISNVGSCCFLCGLANGLNENKHILEVNQYINESTILKASSSHAINCTTGHRPHRVSASHSTVGTERDK